MLNENWKKHIIGIVLRLPAVLVLEFLYMGSLTLKDFVLLQNSTYFKFFPYLDNILFIFSWILLLCPPTFISAFYLQTICLSCVCLSHCIFNLLLPPNLSYFNISTLLMDSTFLSKFPIETDSHIQTKVTIFLIQQLLFLFSSYIYVELSKRWELYLFIGPLLPWFALFFDICCLETLVNFSYQFTCFSFLLITIGVVGRILKQLHLAWLKLKLIIGFYGWYGILSLAKFEYQVQNLIMCCWVVRFLPKLFFNVFVNDDGHKHLNFTLWEDPFLETHKVLIPIAISISECLSTTINLFGLALITANIVKCQYFLIRSWLHWSFESHRPDVVSGPMTGAIDGITVLVMTLYSDLLNSSLEHRFTMINYILFTIASSQFQSFFNIIDPMLMALSTAHNGSIWQNIRILLLSLSLLLVSGVLSYMCLSSMSSSFWIFILTYNYLNTFSLMFGSLIIYSVLTFDYVFTQGWDNLDDVMFYIRGACRAIEFFITLSMCGYIIGKFYNEMTSIVVILLLAVYTYYCIVQRGGEGWKIWSMRRNAAKKVRSLPHATKEEIEEKEDVCPICRCSFSLETNAAKKMHCGHIFHENCLKKWFYIQDKCPICYTQFCWES